MIRTAFKVCVIAVTMISINVTSFVSAADVSLEKERVITFDINEARLEQELTVSEPTEGHIKYVEMEIVKQKEEEQKLLLEEARKNEIAERIRSYLASRGAPLADYARVIVDASEKYGVEPELIAAISIIESGGGRINFKPHNAWGWGRQSWSDWETAINEYTKGLAEGYVLKGLDTPSEIAPIYCPPNRFVWAKNVSKVMSEMKS